MSDHRKAQALGKETSAAIAVTDGPRPGATSTVAFVLLVGLGALLASGALQAIADILGGWNDRYGAFSHGYLVLGLALWLAWRSLRAEPLPEPRAFWPALLPLAMLLAMLVLAEVLFIGPVRVALLPPALLAAVALVAGLPTARRLTVPVLFLYLGLPVWNFLNPLLQALTTRMAGQLVLALGVPAQVEGNFVYLPSGTFEIASGCAGLNYFMVALTVAAVAATMLLDELRWRLGVFAAAMVAGVVANWIRVTSLVVIGHATQMQHYLVRVDHLMFGWVVFAVAMLPVYVLVARSPRRVVATRQREVPTPSSCDWRAIAGRAIPALIAAALLLVAPRFAADTGAAAAPAPAPSFAGTPVASFPSGWRPSISGATESRFVATGSGAADPSSVEAYVAWYPRQTRDARPSLFDNSAGGVDFRLARTGLIDRAKGPNRVQELEGIDGSRRRLVWTWTLSGGRVANTKLELRLRDLQGFLRGRRDSAVLAIATDCAADCDDARLRLERFLAGDPLR
jgi:EpsI family protein